MKRDVLGIVIILLVLSGAGSTVTCELPEGHGYEQPVLAYAFKNEEIKSEEHYFVSYAQPNITDLHSIDCEAGNETDIKLQECPRNGSIPLTYVFATTFW